MVSSSRGLRQAVAVDEGAADDGHEAEPGHDSVSAPKMSEDEHAQQTRLARRPRRTASRPWAQRPSAGPSGTGGAAMRGTRRREAPAGPGGLRQGVPDGYGGRPAARRGGGACRPTLASVPPEGPRPDRRPAARSRSALASMKGCTRKTYPRRGAARHARARQPCSTSCAGAASSTSPPMGSRLASPAGRSAATSASMRAPRSLHVGHLLQVFLLTPPAARRRAARSSSSAAATGHDRRPVRQVERAQAPRRGHDRGQLGGPAPAARALPRLLAGPDPAAHGRQPRLAGVDVGHRVPARHRQALHGAVHARQGLRPGAPLGRHELHGVQLPDPPGGRLPAPPSRTRASTCRWAARTSGATSRPASSSSAASRAARTGVDGAPTSRRAFGLCSPLLLTRSGQKMGKSETRRGLPRRLR